MTLSLIEYLTMINTDAAMGLLNGFTQEASIQTATATPCKNKTN
jgi:hypothetical protein